MILNAYDTTVGKPFKTTDKVENTLKTLALLNKIERSNRENLFVIDHSNGDNVHQFIYPLSVQSLDRKFVTFVDKRAFITKNNVLINEPEWNAMWVAANLQQDIQENNLANLLLVRNTTLVAFSQTIGGVLARKANCDIRERLIVVSILAHYYNCLLSNPNSNVSLSSKNAIKTALRFDDIEINEIIDNVGYLSNLFDLLKAIQSVPALYKLKTLDLKSLIVNGSGIWFSSVGRQIPGAALEHPALFTGMCYATANNKVYHKTRLGEQLDPKFNKTLETFIKTINIAFRVK